MFNGENELVLGTVFSVANEKEKYYLRLQISLGKILVIKINYEDNKSDAEYNMIDFIV